MFLFTDFRAGNFHDSLSDAKTATDLQPSYVKAIFRGKDESVTVRNLGCDSSKRQ